LKKSKTKTETEIAEDVRRILIFVSDLLGGPFEGQEWMKTPKCGGKSPIEMIHDGNLGDVMVQIHQEFFTKSS
jgi:hypothetical protein